MELWVDVVVKDHGASYHNPRGDLSPEEYQPMRSPTRFHSAIERFDAANAEDPNVELVDGVAQPRELVYAKRMTARLDRYRPDASEPVRLAARCQHIRRWVSPRTDFPEGRAGYRRWRTELARFHASSAAAILREVGYDASVVTRVESLLRKEQLTSDPDVQLFEDVICLVFLDHYLADFASKHEDSRLLDVLAKAWNKMTAEGRVAALELELPAPERSLVERAIGHL